MTNHIRRFFIFFSCLIILSGCTDKSLKKHPRFLQKSKIKSNSVSSFKHQKNQQNFFQCNPQRTGSTNVHFKSKELKLKWTYKLSDHTFAYNQSTNIWSRSAATLLCSEYYPKKYPNALIYIGGYDKKLHCIDSETGKKVWRHTTGGEIIHTPCTGIIKDIPYVWFTSSDRTIYALNAVTGKKIWSNEIMPWTTTTLPAYGSSPVILKIDNSPILYFTFHLIDNNPFNRVESGRLYALNAVNGKIVWSIELSNSPLNSPTVVDCINDKKKLTPRIAVTDTTGVVWLIDPVTGKLLLKHISDYFIHSDASYSKNINTLFFGSRFGIITGLDPLTGDTLFTYRTGHYVDSTPSILELNGQNLIFAGSYDRNIYCIDTTEYDTIRLKNNFKNMDQNKFLKWRFKGEYQFFSSCQSAFFEGHSSIIASGFDRKIYIIDIMTGKLIWNFKHGELLWPYIKRGDAIFSSPGVFYSQKEKNPKLIYPAFDGILYCFK